MMAKVYKDNTPSGIAAHRMKDGDVGEIIKWSGGNYIGTVVQRYENLLISVGEPSGCGWGNWFDQAEVREDCRVRLLAKGTKIEL